MDQISNLLSQNVNFELPEMHVVLFILAVCGILSYVLVEVVKKAISGLEVWHKIVVDAWWHRPLFRILSIIFGGITGLLVAALPGALIGACAGGLNALIVGVAKNFLKKKAASFETSKDPPQQS